MRVYRATKELPYGRRFSTISEIESYINNIISTSWWKDNIFRYVCEGDLANLTSVRKMMIEDFYIKIVINNRKRRKNIVARGARTGLFSGEIILPKGYEYKKIILHEICHVILPDYLSPHGVEYAKIFLSIIKRFMGNENEELLKKAYEKNKVKFTKDFCRVVKNNVPIKMAAIEIEDGINWVHLF